MPLLLGYLHILILNIILYLLIKFYTNGYTMVFMLFTKRRLLGSNLNKFLQMAISSSKRDSRSLVEGSLNRLHPGNIFFLKMINYCLSFKNLSLRIYTIISMVNDRKATYPIGMGAVLSLKTNCQLYFIIFQELIQR